MATNKLLNKESLNGVFAEIKRELENIPQSVHDLDPEDEYATKEDAQAMVDEAKVTGASVDYQEDGGSPGATVDFSEGSLGFTLKNLKMKFSDLTPEERALLKGEQGRPGADRQPVESGDVIIAHDLGDSEEQVMSQKAVSDELNGINVTENEIDLDGAFNYPYVIWQDKWNYRTDGQFGKHICVSSGQTYKVRAADDYMTRIVFLATFGRPTKNAAITPLSYVDIPAGETQIVTMPTGAYHVYIQDNTQASTTNMQIPDYFALVVSDSIRGTLDWAINPASKKAISDKETLAKYNFGDCTVDGTLRNDATFTPQGNGFLSSSFITIPQGATSIIYKGVLPVYRVYTSDDSIELCGLVITDANHVVQWYNESGNGEVDLADYPNAAYICFCPALRNITSTVEIVRRGGYQNIESSANGEDVTRQYGCTVEGSASSSSSVVKYMASESPCLEDGYIDLVHGKFTDGTCHLHIGFIDQNNYLVITNSFDINTSAGFQTIDLSARGIRMRKGDYLFAEYASSYAVPYFGVAAGSPYTFTVQQDNMRHDFAEGTNVILSLAYTVKSRKLSQVEMSEELESVKADVAENTTEIANLKANKKYFVEDEVTHENYQIVVRNGILSLRKAQYSKAVVLGNSLTDHAITETWWGVWGMAATKREYDFVHIMQEGLRAKDPNAEVVPIHLADWERNFGIDLDTLIDGRMTSETDLVVIRLCENVPTANIPQFHDALSDLVDYVMEVSPMAKVVITGEFWNYAPKETILQTVAAEKGVDFIKLNQFDTSAYKESIGHYVYGDDEEIHEITDAGVAEHPSNIGMLGVANAILTAIGYEAVQKSYSLQEVTVGGVTGMMYVEDER